MFFHPTAAERLVSASKKALQQTVYTLEELSRKELCEQTDDGINHFMLDHSTLIAMCDEAFAALDDNRHIFFENEVTPPLAFAKRLLIEANMLLGFLTGRIALLIDGQPFTVSIDREPFEEADTSWTLDLCRQAIQSLDEADVSAFREDEDGVLKPLSPSTENRDDEE